MFIAKWLLAIGTVLILAGVGVGIAGLAQHPGEKAKSTVVVEERPSNSTAKTDSTAPIDGSQPPQPGQNSGAPVEGGGLTEDTAKVAFEILPTAQKWLAFVVFGILLIVLGIAFLTGGGVIALLTTAINIAVTGKPGPIPGVPGTPDPPDPPDPLQPPAGGAGGGTV